MRQQILCSDAKYVFSSVFLNIGFCGTVFLTWCVANAGAIAALSAIR